MQPAFHYHLSNVMAYFFIFMKRVNRLLVLSCILLVFQNVFGQPHLRKQRSGKAGKIPKSMHYTLPFRYHDSSSLAAVYRRQEAALALLDSFDTLKPSPYWPNVHPALFLKNLRDNVTLPAIINQGKATNFCGYAAFSHILLVYMPDIYVKVMLELYENGRARLPKKELQPSISVRKAAGSLRGKGDLDIRHADQLWFLTLADQFKGYLNFFDKRYKLGDENLIWAATNYAKFNKMLKVIGSYKVDAAGSDLIRPWKKNFAQYIGEQQQEGLVLLYLNSKLLHPSKYSFFKLRAPTHFVVLYNIDQKDDLITFQYWDYGLRTQQLIPAKRFRKLIFGISVIKKG